MKLSDLLGMRRRPSHHQSAEYLMRVIENVTGSGGIPKIDDRALQFAKTYLPKGCEFYDSNGQLTPGGALVAMVEMERQAARLDKQEPCISCHNDTCEARTVPYDALKNKL